MKPATAVSRLSISCRTLARSFAVALVFAILWTGFAMSAGPTGWGGGSCIEVTAFPANLTAPGVYCLSYKYIDFPLTKGALITISADNVVFDMNGATLDGTPKGTAFSWGIRSYGRSNVTVRNGTIRGFNYAISLTAPLGFVNTRVRPSHSFLVENIRAIESRTTGIEVIGFDSVVRRNFVTHTGGSPDPGVSAHAWGMIVGGTGLRVIDNDVTHTHVNTAYSGGITTGVFLNAAQAATIINNRINEAQFGIYGANGNWGKYRDNVTVNVAVPYTGGTNIGNNN